MMPTSQPTFLVRVLRLWIPMVAVSAAILFTVYVLVQQSYRMTANDPQIQMAEDAATALANGASPATLVSSAIVDMGQSLSPFLIIVDTNGKVLARSGALSGTTPVPPKGVLDYTRQHSEDRLTWQPSAKVRIATVVHSVSGTSGAFVIAGRSLREVEIREDNLGKLTLIGFVGTLILSLIAVVAIQRLFPDKESAKRSVTSTLPER